MNRSFRYRSVAQSDFNLLTKVSADDKERFAKTLMLENCIKLESATK